MGKKKERQISKHNDFIEASYKLTPTQAKLLCRLATIVQPNDEDFKKYQFSVKELLKEFGLGEKHYEYLEKSIDKLVEKTFKIPKKNSNLTISIFSSAEYFYNEGIIELEFSPKMKPYLLNLKETFTTYKAENVLLLKSFYSIRLYELLKQYENFTKRTFEIKELRKILAIEETQYSRYNDFKRFVILQAQKEFKKYCDIDFTFEEHKTGRKITSITFHIISKITKKPQIEPPKTQTFDISKYSHTLEKLTNLGVNYKVAEKICKTYTLSQIEANIEYTNEQINKGTVKDKSAYIVGAIKNDYNSNLNFEDNPPTPNEADRRQSTKENGATGEIQSPKNEANKEPLSNEEAQKRLDDMIKNLAQTKKI